MLASPINVTVAKSPVYAIYPLIYLQVLLKIEYVLLKMKGF